jgi:hypothetical protein
MVIVVDWIFHGNSHGLVYGTSGPSYFGVFAAYLSAASCAKHVGSSRRI